MKVVALFILLGLSVPAQAGPDPWALAEKAIKRLPPSAFRQLPHAISNYLARRGCTIPQSFVRNEPHNVISGNFFGRGGKDWAVVCSRAGESKILVFARDGSRPSAELSADNDKDFLQEIGVKRIGYSRIIGAVGPAYILEHYRAYGGPKPPPMNHQGIDDGFAEKASTVRYFCRGRWIELTGAD